MYQQATQVPVPAELGAPQYSFRTATIAWAVLSCESRRDLVAAGNEEKRVRYIILPR